MAIVSSSLFENTALRSAVYSDRGATRIGPCHREAEWAHRGIFPCETGFLALLPIWGLGRKGACCWLQAAPWAGGAGPLRDRGCRAAGSESVLVLSYVSQDPAVQQAHTGSPAPAASNRRDSFLSQGNWVCKLQKDLSPLSLPLELELNYLLLQSFPHLSHC